jgi:hypothetical protein
MLKFVTHFLFGKSRKKWYNDIGEYGEIIWIDKREFVEVRIWLQAKSI